MATNNVDEMSFLDHLEDLRWHLIRITIAVILAGIIAFCFPKILFGVIIFDNIDDFIVRKAFVKNFIDNKGNINLVSYKNNISALSILIPLSELRISKLFGFLLFSSINCPLLSVFFKKSNAITQKKIDKEDLKSDLGDE